MSYPLANLLYPLKASMKHGYYVKATPEARQMAAEELDRNIAQDLKPEQVSDCRSHLGKILFLTEKGICHYTLRSLHST